MFNATTHMHNATLKQIINDANALGFKLPATVTAKLSRGDALTNLVTPITSDDVSNATTETIPELVERIARNSAFQGPAAQQALTNLQSSLDLDLYNTFKDSAGSLYDAVAKKLNKEFDAVNVAAAGVPYAFASNPSTWERQTKDAIESFKKLRELIQNVAPLVNLLHNISTTFFPALRTSQWEVEKVTHLHTFYDLSAQVSPLLARFELPTAKIISVETVTYLAARDVFLRAQSIDERRASEQALIDQAKGYAQLDDGSFVSANEAPEPRGGLHVPPLFNTNISR